MTSYRRTRLTRLFLIPVAVLVAFLTPVLSAPGVDRTPEFDGKRAFADLKRLVAFGPHPSGSAALDQTRAWMMERLKQAGCPVEEDSFVGSTPDGSLPMTNLIVKIPGERQDVVMLAGHYDTKRFDNFRFVGANDGGSSAAELLEFGRSLCRRRNPLKIWLVFFDGEEAVRQWSATDGTYGSRHLVQKLTDDGELGRVKALILVDMIGDAELGIRRDDNSTKWLTDLVFDTARQLGYGKYFLSDETAIFDDHNPFVDAGVSAVDLIDLDYGPHNSYWHTRQDTVEHCSPQSLAIVGRVVLGTLDRLATDPNLR